RFRQKTRLTLAACSRDSASARRTINRPGPTLPSTTWQSISRLRRRAASLRSRRSQIFVPRTHLHPTSSYSPLPRANPSRPTEFHAMVRDTFLRQSLYLPQPHVPSPDLRSAQLRNAAADRTFSNVPDTS